ncbi:MAG TPA: hypothetical protein VGV38_23545 [Pyrinomonadaceae bacterium]|nr:hypothetical protein [Pyrinomonadaceae bacterium]
MSERDEGTKGGVTNADETGGTGGYGGTSEASTGGADEAAGADDEQETRPDAGA